MSATTPSRARWGTKKPSSEPAANDDDDEMSNMNNNNDDNNNNNENAPEPKPTANKVLDAAIGTRKETISATNRILRDLEAAKALEIEALEALHKDLERVRRVEGSLDEINSTMGRAKMQITAIGRKLYRDGCFKICLALLVCAVIVIIVMLSMEGFERIGKGIGGGGTNVQIVNTPQGDAEDTSTTVPTTTTP